MQRKTIQSIWRNLSLIKMVLNSIRIIVEKKKKPVQKCLCIRLSIVFSFFFVYYSSHFYIVSNFGPNSSKISRNNAVSMDNICRDQPRPLKSFHRFFLFLLFLKFQTKNKNDGKSRSLARHDYTHSINNKYYFDLAILSKREAQLLIIFSWMMSQNLERLGIINFFLFSFFFYIPVYSWIIVFFI